MNRPTWMDERVCDNAFAFRWDANGLLNCKMYCRIISHNWLKWAPHEAPCYSSSFHIKQNCRRLQHVIAPTIICTSQWPTRQFVICTRSSTPSDIVYNHLTLHRLISHAVNWTAASHSNMCSKCDKIRFSKWLFKFALRFCPESFVFSLLVPFLFIVYYQ